MQVHHSTLYEPTKLRLNQLLDVIELGVPFTDPIADGPTIQKSNTVRMLSDMTDGIDHMQF